MALDASQRNELDPWIHEIFICIRLCYSYCNWQKTVEPLLRHVGIFEEIHQNLPEIKFSCFESSLANIRRYDEFLFPRTNKTRQADIRADDFPGFNPTRGMLPEDQRAGISKRLMHLTDQQVSQGDWDIAVRDMLPRIAEFQKEFTAYIKGNWPDDSPKYEDACSVDTMIDECLAFIENEIAT